MCIDETGQSSIEVRPGHGRVEAGGIVVLPVPRNSEGWSSFERNGHSAAIPDGASV